MNSESILVHGLFPEDTRWYLFTPHPEYIMLYADLSMLQSFLCALQEVEARFGWRFDYRAVLHRTRTKIRKLQEKGQSTGYTGEQIKALDGAYLPSLTQAERDDFSRLAKAGKDVQVRADINKIHARAHLAHIRRLHDDHQGSPLSDENKLRRQRIRALYPSVHFLIDTTASDVDEIRRHNDYARVPQDIKTQCSAKIDEAVIMYRQQTLMERATRMGWHLDTKVDVDDEARALRLTYNPAQQNHRIRMQRGLECDNDESKGDRVIRRAEWVRRTNEAGRKATGQDKLDSYEIDEAQYERPKAPKLRKSKADFMRAGLIPYTIEEDGWANDKADVRRRQQHRIDQRVARCAAQTEVTFQAKIVEYMNAGVDEELANLYIREICGTAARKGNSYVFLAAKWATLVNKHHKAEGDQLMKDGKTFRIDRRRSTEEWRLAQMPAMVHCMRRMYIDKTSPAHNLPDVKASDATSAGEAVDERVRRFISQALPTNVIRATELARPYVIKYRTGKNRKGKNEQVRLPRHHAAGTGDATCTSGEAWTSAMV